MPCALGQNMLCYPSQAPALPFMHRFVSSWHRLKTLALLLGVGVAGLVLNSTASAQTILIPTNGVWDYFDHGEDLAPTLWRSLAFEEDVLWKSGAAPLGY